MNRVFRRMQKFGKSFSGRRAEGDMPADTSDKLVDANTPQQVSSVRAKNEGHGKKTADKWNQ